MYIKLTKSGPRRYVQLVEAYRDDHGKPKQRTLANLGRYEQVVGEVDSIINGLMRVAGRLPDDQSQDLRVAFQSARCFGDVYALHELWHQLGFDALRRIFRSRSRTTDVEQLLRVMVFNRLCDPHSKLGVLRWLETVSLPGIDTTRITHQQLLRSMDVLIGQKAKVEEVLAGTLRPLIDQELSVVFYDLTTIAVSGTGEVDEDLRAFRRSKEGGVARQVVLGLVQTAEGLPIAHEVLEGNVHEASTLMPMLQRLTARYPVRRVVLVADRGLLNLDNLTELDAMTLPSGEPLEYILAVPATRYSDFDACIQPLHARYQRQEDAPASWVDETRWQDRRLVVHHDDAMAQAKTHARREQIERLEALADQWCDKLGEQEAGIRSRGRKLSEGGVTAKFYKAVSEAKLGHILNVDLQNSEFGYFYRATRVDSLERLDGKLLLVTNVVDASPENIVRNYKALADIERGFRVLKSELEIGPMYHRLPDRIRAHAFICFIALILHRVMRMRLKAAQSSYSVDRAIEKLSQIQKHVVQVNGREVGGLSTMTPEQLDIFRALEIKKPAWKST